MKKRTIFAIITAFIFVSLMLSVSQAQQQGTDNLLQNPGFEEGHYSQDGIAEITVPNGWRMHWVDDVPFPGSFNDLPAYRPETVVWNIAGAPPHEADLFWRDGIYTLKIFKSWAPMYAGLSQDVSGLQVGRRYRLVAPVYVDVFADFQDGQKVAPADRPDSAQVRLGASPVGAGWRDETQIAYSGWWHGGNISPFYQDYPVFIYDFTATASDMTVWIEVRSIYPHPNNGFFIDTVGLYTLDEFDVVAQPVDPNAPTPTPFPTPTPRPDGAIVHVVQGGDTFWTIAIQYAPALGVTPQESLAIIQERNNNPAFINPGQELLIAEPAQIPVAVEETTETESETNDDPKTEPEETTDTVKEETNEEPATSDDAKTEEDSRDAETQAGNAETESGEEVALVPQGGNDGGSDDSSGNTTGAVCVTIFEDTSGDGIRTGDSETTLANATITLSQGGQTRSVYNTTGAEDQYCFESLTPDTYQIQFFPPAGYRPTTQANGWLAVSGGVQMPIAFGAQIDGAAQEVADTGSTQTGETADTTSDATPAEEGEGIGIGTIVLGVAGFLVILAGIGVVLLRRG